MQGINKLTLLGNVGTDPEFFGDKTPVLKFTVAVNEKWGDEEHTEWFNIVVFGKFAEALRGNVTKGKMVYVEGRVSTRKYEDKEGREQRWTEVKVDVLRLLGGGSDERREGGRDSDRRGNDDRGSGSRGSSDGGSGGRSSGNPWGGRRG